MSTGMWQKYNMLLDLINVYSGFQLRSKILWLRETFRSLFGGSIYHGNYSGGLQLLRITHLDSFRGT